MGKPQSAAKLQQAGGALVDDPDRELICEAFFKAVDDFCNDRSLGANRSFNDYFFKYLANQGQRGKDIAGAIEREVPFIFQRGEQGLESVGRAAQLADHATSEAQQLAQTVMGAMAKEVGNQGLSTAAKDGLTGALTGAANWGGAGNALLTAGAVAWRAWGLEKFPGKVFSAKLGKMIDIIKNPRVYPRFADGVYKNKIFEIKGPGDKLKGRQAGDAKRCSTKGEPYVVGCKSCSVNCSGGCPKTLNRGQLPPAPSA